MEQPRNSQKIKISVVRNFLMLFALFCFTTVIHPLTVFGVVLLNGDFSQVDSKGFPENWQLTNFHDKHQPQVTVVTEKGRNNLALLFNEDGEYCFSFHQLLPNFNTLPGFDQNSTLCVTFSYKVDGNLYSSISAALSGGAGCGLPCSRDWLGLVRDGKWHQMSIWLPLTKVNNQMEFEYVLEREFKAGEKFMLANVQAEFGPWPPIVEFNPTNPVSGVLFTDASSQKVSGLFKTAKAYAGYQARVSLFGPAGQEKPLIMQNLKVSYPSTRWELDLKSIPVGKYLAVAEILGKDNNITLGKKIVIWKIEPTDTTSRVINGKVYYGGKTIVLLGTYHVSDWAVSVTNTENKRIGKPLLTRQQMLEGLTGQRFNSFFFTSGVPAPDFLEDARKYHLFVIPLVSGLGREWGGAPLVEQIAPAKDDPRIFGWYGSDEPGPGRSAQKAAEVYYDLKSVSPHKLVATAVGGVSVLDFFNGETTPADLILMDIYQVTSPDADLSLVGTEVKSAVAYAQKYGNIAVGVVPQAFIFNSGSKTSPEPTPEQLRAQVYLGLVNGARAFFPYSYIEDYGGGGFNTYSGAPSGMSLNPKRQRWFLPDSKMWLILPDIFQEIKTLENFILEDGEVLDVTSENEAIQFMAKQVGKESCLIAVNPKATPQKSTFYFSSPIRKVTPRFNTSPAEPKGEELPLEFKGYEVKVFQFGD